MTQILGTFKVRTFRSKKRTWKALEVRFPNHYNWQPYGEWGGWGDSKKEESTPEQAIQKALYKHGFKWSNYKRLYYKQNPSRADIVFAKKLTGNKAMTTEQDLKLF